MARLPLQIPLICGLIGLTCATLLAHRLGSGADGDTTAVATPAVAMTVLSAVPTPEVEATPQPLLSSMSVSDLLTRYLQLQAGSPELRAAWSGHIREVVVGLRTAKIRTDLGDSLDDKRLAEEIASAVARFSTSPLGQGTRPLDVEVLGADQQPLASQTAAGLARQSPRR